MRSHLTLPVTESHDSTYTVLDNDVIIAVTRSAHGTSAITIPTAGMWAGRVLIFDDAGLNANNQTITISTEGSEDIDGGDTATITTAGGSVRLYSDGSNWFTF
ncbi:MAG: hypothetical protein WC642_11185 [Nocardioides sp.]